MTKAAESPHHIETGNGITQLFPLGFDVFSLTDVQVQLRDLNDLPVAITRDGLGTYDYFLNYVFDNASDRYTNVVVAFVTAPPTGYAIGLSRLGTQDQTLDLTASGALPAEAIEKRFDRLVSMVQDLQAQISRAPLAPIGSSNFIDAGGKILSGLADPVDISDAVTKGFLTAGSLSIDFIDGVTVSSIAALKALPAGGSNPMTAFVTGYLVQGDGGGGLYYYDASSVATDDGAVYITPNAGIGRWRLNPNGWISRRQAGSLSVGATALYATNALGIVKTPITADPDDAVALGFAGVTKVLTQSDGAIVSGIARATAAAVAAGDLLRKGEFDAAQLVQDNALTAGLATKSNVGHAHNYSLLTRFASSNQVVSTAGAVAHSLGAQPTPGHYGASLVCLVSDLSYAVGDRVNLATAQNASGGQFYAPSIWASATQVGWAMATTTPFIVTKGSTVPAAITASRWAIVAWSELVS